ncbi:MAG: isoleucyl-tRNA synthetase [Parcubacteria group bacterium Gr01-1014_20]|nr:MAG: isoleucyl-tRNA synthetase [Parcubacteria group bacterium Gr01-1014_20]
MFVKDLKEFNLPKTEEKVLEYWKKNQIFEKTLALRKPTSAKASKGKKHFVFFEGPPTANGRPGIHHVLARAFKDVILRYKTMRGFNAPRRAGWDTHGLPVEIQVEKELGLKSKKDIEKFGIAEFNKKCKESVWKFKDEWERLTERMGFWLDMKDPYVTYEKDYIETLWWIIAQFWKKKLLYKGNRIVNWCTRCGTGLSSHEMAQGYKEVTDNSVYVKFKLKKGQKVGKDFSTNDKTYILSWTTTPWTLPGNVALAAGEKIRYVFIEADGEVLVLAKERMEAVGVQGRIIKETMGKDLVGLSYQPLFEVDPLKSKNSYKVYAADFVTTTDGTGVVHTAVMYGEDDYKLGVKMGLTQHHTVDVAGKFTKDVKVLAGMYVKDKKTEEKILNYLKARSYHLKTEPHKHDYPHCWRCSTPLLYYARSSWFVAMSKLKKELLASNNKINWTPEHVKNGRFGEWLREVKDWNFSRERYWGTPLPIWECSKCGITEAIESLADLDGKTGGARNRYWVMRHGQSEAMMVGVIDAGKGKYRLTDLGRKQAEKTAKRLAKEKIDLVISSDVLRTKETAQIVARVLEVGKPVLDERLREINLGVLAGKSVREYSEILPTLDSRILGKPEGGESITDVRTRMWSFVQEIEKKYKGKNILLVSHEYPIWILSQVMNGWTNQELILEKTKGGKNYIEAGEVWGVAHKVLPRDNTGLVDLHRPYIDEIFLKCSKCEGKMKRVKELADVWFDSGAMPLAQSHFPFDRAKSSKSQITNNKEHVDYPADYICEAVDQTRGWFYTLLAIATALGKNAPYRNVISLGHINDKHGQKMSKSKGNIVDPWMMAEKYGMDAVRWYMYAATPPGEPKNFDEQELLKTYRRMHLILWNSLLFYKTYAVSGSSRKLGLRPKSKNLLDLWMLSRLDEAIVRATKAMDRYDIRGAALEIEKLVDDLSRWYIRRSRRRLQRPESKADFEACASTLQHVLASISKMMAPFNPFFSEVVWNTLGGASSIHLEDWPTRNIKSQAPGNKLVEEMGVIRGLATLGLAKRAEVGVKVRQPLSVMKIKPKVTNKQSLQILADEVNVKKTIVDAKIKGEIELDTRITAELKEEGILRELVRAIQDLRQRAGLEPGDAIVVMLELPDNLREIVLSAGGRSSSGGKNEAFLKNETGAKSIEYKRSEKFEAEAITKFEDSEVWLAVRKI